MRAPWATFHARPALASGRVCRVRRDRTKSSAGALAVALDAHRTWQDLAQLAPRRPAVVSLEVFGDPAVAQHRALALDDPLDVAAAALAVVCAHLMPPMGLDARDFDQGGRQAIRHREMLYAVRSLKTRIRESSTGERAAALHVAAGAVQRVRAERWFEVID